MRAHMGGLPETHVMYHSTHITDIITDRDDVRHPEAINSTPTTSFGEVHGIKTKGVSTSSDTQRDHRMQGTKSTSV